MTFQSDHTKTADAACEVAMDLCVDEKDGERERRVQSAVRAKKRARAGWGTEGWGGEGGGGARFFALTVD